MLQQCGCPTSGSLSFVTSCFSSPPRNSLSLLLLRVPPPLPRPPLLPHPNQQVRVPSGSKHLEIGALPSPRFSASLHAVPLLTDPVRYGVDGTWSPFTFYVGSPAQVVYLTVATALSELWVVSNGGCVPGERCFLKATLALSLTRLKFNYASMPGAVCSTGQPQKHGVR